MSVSRCVFIPLLIFVLALDCTRSLAQDCTHLCGIPCYARWYDTYGVIDREESRGLAIAVTSAGEALVPGVSRSYSNTDRIILKYRADGTRVNGYDINGIPWYIGTISSGYYSDFPWQKIVLDEAHSRFFVMYSAVSVPDDNYYRYFLAAHELASGEKLSSWGASRYVGSSTRMDGDVAVDWNGNVWTIIEDSPAAAVGFKVKKWNGDDGTNISPTNITPPQDYFHIFSPGTARRLIGFGTSNSAQRIFLAYSQFGQGGSYDLVVSLWDGDLHFLEKEEYDLEYPAPDMVPAGEFSSPMYNMTDHPYFSNAIVDSQGNLVAAGCYRFLRWIWEFEQAYVFPVAFKFGIGETGNTIETMYQYVDEAKPIILSPESAPREVRLVDRHDGSVFLMMWHTYLINSAGQFASRVLIRAPFGVWPPEDTDNPRCYYFDFLSFHESDYSSGKLYFAGSAETMWLGCSGEPNRKALSACYDNGLHFVCCVIKPFDWYKRIFLSDYHLWARGIGSFASSEYGFARSPMRIPAMSEERDVARETLFELTFSLASRQYPPEFPEELRTRIFKAIEQANQGEIFTEQMRASLQKDIGSNNELMARDHKLSGRLLEAANAIALEAMKPRTKSQKVARAKFVRAWFSNSIAVAFSGVEKPGEISLSVRGGVPALTQELEPLWPLATYHFEFTGSVKKGAAMDIEFNLAGFAVPRNLSSVMVLEWDGTSYRDITVACDIEAGRVVGRTSKSSDVVLFASAAHFVGATCEPSRE